MHERAGAARGCARRVSPWLGALWAIAAAGAFGACGGGSGVECNVGADCASGACSADGKCVAAPGGGDAGNHLDAAADAARDASGFEDQSAQDTGGCSASSDGSISSAQVPLGPGLHASYLVTTNATTSTAGTMNSDGTRSWDYSAALPGDETIVFLTDDPSGQWWTSSFSGATYATLLSSTSNLLGVFQLTSSALALRGVVSPSSGTTQTELSYAPPVTTLAFPMSMGTSWQTTSTVTGQDDGVESYYTEAYTSNVDAKGTLKTPYATFNVLRVNTLLTRTVGVLVSTTRTYTWIAACFGPVATIVSQTDEPNTEFTSAAEVRRLAP